MKRLAPAPLTVSHFTLPDSPGSPFKKVLSFHTTPRHCRNSEEIQEFVARYFPGFQTTDDLLTHSPRYQFQKFQDRFSHPAELAERSYLEACFVKHFINTLLPACEGFPDLDGSDWTKPEIKTKLSQLWALFTPRQKTLIHNKLKDRPLGSITLGTLRQIDYQEEPSTSSTPETKEPQS